jgi:hypothetical protein
MVLGEAYRKDYLLLRSRPCPPGSAAALACIYVSARDRPEAAATLAALESSRREDPLEAARWLDIPACCAAAFAADFHRSRQDQDTLNDDACRRLIAARTDGSAPWWSNPLSDHELLGFYPCQPDCPAAATRAQRNLELLRRTQPPEADRADRRLRRAVLYLRLPFFAVVQGHTSPCGGLLVEDLRVNRFADPVVAAAQALLAAHLRARIPRGSILAPTALGIEVRGATATTKLEASHASDAPLLVGWQDAGR